MNDVAGGFGLETVVSISPDGGVEISAPAVHTKQDDTDPDKFNENLAQRDGIHLDSISHEVLDGIEWDQKSRAKFIESYSNGVDLLGLEIKDDRNAKTSQVGHPLLLEAVVRAQSAAGAELMPAAGPCKVEEAGGSTGQLDEMAQAFQTDMNWYLTTGAPEYYPDTDRGLFGLFYGGNMFKKVYEHPLRRRPVSETVNIADLIVSEFATDLETAARITHVSEMSDVLVRRMQTFADWRDVILGQAQPNLDPAKQAQNKIEARSPMQARPQDVPHTIYETTVEMDLSDYGFYEKGLPDLPLNYIVTLDKDSRGVLAIRRGWKNGDEQFKRKQRFVHYGMVPAFNFLCLGFVHLLGNQTKALRGIWRILITSGMYANAPGGMKTKGVRTSVSDIRPGPGEWVDIDLNGADDIRKVLMEMPYKDVSSAFMALAEAIGNDAMRMAGMANMEVGEGRTNVPVGTMMSMIEVATQTMAAVHKRLHRAQARELELIRECFIENPEALAKFNPSPQRVWTRADEFANMNLVPASDPNVPSQIHRIQLATALITVAGANPTLYDQIAAHKRAWRTIGVSDADSFVLPQQAPSPPGAPGPAPPDPALGQAKLMEAQAKVAQVKQETTDSQRKAATEEVDAQHRAQELEQDGAAQAAKIASDERIASMREQTEAERLEVEKVRLASEHARDVHSTTLDAATRLHATKTQADTAVRTARMRPKPSGGKK